MPLNPAVRLSLIEAARVRLAAPPERPASPWGGLGAAAFAAGAAVLMAAVMVLGPGMALGADEPTADTAPRIGTTPES